MSAWTLRAALATLLGFSLIGLVGCGGDKLGEERDLLRQMAMKVEDLPDGFLLVAEGFTTNDDVVKNAPDPKDEEAQLKNEGRVLGFEVVFEPASGPAVDSRYVGVQNTVTLYETEDGAKQSFAEAVKSTRESDWEGSHPGFTDLKVRELAARQLGDEALWIRITGTAQREPGKAPELLIDDIVLWRQSNVRGFLKMAFVGDNTTAGYDFARSVVQGLLETQEQTIAAVLAAAAPIEAP